MLDQPVIITIGTVVTGLTLIGIGWSGSKIFHRNGHNGKSHVTKNDLALAARDVVIKKECEAHRDQIQQNCNMRYGRLHDKATLTQYLLLEITTEEQQKRAVQRMETFGD